MHWNALSLFIADGHLFTLPLTQCIIIWYNFLNWPHNSVQNDELFADTK
jgi:hypothetical protein